MTSGGARRGRRDNGLVAAAYAAAGDVDPRVGEHLLDVLAIRGIAAYLQPAADLHPVTRATMLSARPTDRLFVDREHLDTARDYLAQLAEEPAAEQPEDGGRDIDTLFAEIIAGYDQPADSVTWPAAEDVDAGRPDTDAPEPTPQPPPSRLRRWKETTVDPLVAADGASADDGTDDDPEEEGYTPPPPPPLPRISPAAVLAVVAIVAGFVLFFNPDLLPVSPPVGMTLGFLGILGGFVTLVWRLRPGRDDDDWDSDDGAVV